MGDLNSLWASWYALINNANSVLQNSAETPFKDESLRSQFNGELYFLRGYAHFELARIFGNVPIVDHVLSVAESQELKQSTARRGDRFRDRRPQEGRGTPPL